MPAMYVKFREKGAGLVADSEIMRNFAAGKSYTTSSLRIPQVLTEARVSGCSGAM